MLFYRFQSLWFPKGSWGQCVLGGSWVVISRVISRITIVITHIKGLVTPLITTHEPPSEASRESGTRNVKRRKLLLVASPRHLLDQSIVSSSTSI